MGGAKNVDDTAAKPPAPALAPRSAPRAPHPPISRDTTVAAYTTTDFYQMTTEVQVALYNSILLAWKEKVRTTVLSFIWG